MANKWFKIVVVKPAVKSGRGNWQHPYDRVGQELWAQRWKDNAGKTRYTIFSGTHYNLPESFSEKEVIEHGRFKTVRRNGKPVYATPQQVKEIDSQYSWALAS